MPPPIATLALALLLASAPAGGQAPPASPAMEAPRVATPAEAAQEPDATPVPQTGLPRPAPVAPTMADYWPVFAGFALVWVGIVGYLLTMGGRSKRLARALAELERGG